MPDRYPSDQTMNSALDPIADVARTAADTVGEARQAVASRLNTATDYVRSFDGKRMLADAERTIKDHPGPALLIAAAFGFVIGRSLTRG